MNSGAALRHDGREKKKSPHIHSGNFVRWSKFQTERESLLSVNILIYIYFEGREQHFSSKIHDLGCHKNDRITKIIVYLWWINKTSRLLWDGLFLGPFWKCCFFSSVFRSEGLGKHIPRWRFLETLVCPYWCGQLKQRFLGTLTLFAHVAHGNCLNVIVRFYFGVTRRPHSPGTPWLDVQV